VPSSSGLIDLRQVPSDVGTRRDTPPYRAASTPVPQDKRKKVEMLFAHLERILNLTRLRLRGPSSARDQFTLAAIAPHLRKPAKLWPAFSRIRRR
jgi:hypothetical protein